MRAKNFFQQQIMKYKKHLKAKATWNETLKRQLSIFDATKESN